MYKNLLVFFAVLISNISFAQNCSCSDSFFWLKVTMEKNDAGFQYAVDNKGQDYYLKHSQSFSDSAKKIVDKEKCAEHLTNWLKFFRNGHLSLRLNTEQISKVQNEEKSEQKNWETFSFNENQFQTYLSKIKDPSFEGIWSSPPYTIGIKKVKENFIGFIISADDLIWRKRQVKLKIREKDDSFSATYFMKDYTPREFENVKLISKNYLKIGFIILKRLSPEFQSNTSIDLFYSLMNSENPQFVNISENTNLLRIPSFSYSEKLKIDSVINSNRAKIINTKNLIIDLRNNGGGSDESFQGILPLIYTNPIRTVGVELLSTPLNNQRMVDFINNSDWSDEDKLWAKEGLEKLNKQIGKFVNLDSTIVTIENFDTIFPKPINVGIIINQNNGSTTEQFLLAAKQSKKVKLFGETTMGVLDISNMHFIDSPCKNYTLGYSLSKSLRIPNMTIDDKGIEPDYYIDDSVSEYEWINFVEEALNY